MLAAGELIGAVLASFLGNCSAGRAMQAVWLAFLAQLPTLGRRRRVLEHFLRTFDAAELHGSQWRVIGAGGYVGRQHEDIGAEQVERVDALTGEYTFEVPKGYPCDPGKRHCPARRGGSAGGLAAHSHRSPKQLNRYRQTLRAGKIMASEQPPHDAPDAVRPRRPDGTWAYAQHWLALPPTPEMLARWRGRTAPPLRDYRRVAGRPYTPAQPPRAGELRELGELAQREA